MKPHLYKESQTDSKLQKVKCPIKKHISSDYVSVLVLNKDMG